MELEPGGEFFAAHLPALLLPGFVDELHPVSDARVEAAQRCLQDRVGALAATEGQYDSGVQVAAVKLVGDQSIRSDGAGRQRIKIPVKEFLVFFNFGECVLGLLERELRVENREL